MRDPTIPLMRDSPLRSCAYRPIKRCVKRTIDEQIELDDA